MANHTDDTVQKTWTLTHPNGDEITIDLLTDSETVRVDGGDGEDFTAPAPTARQVIEQQLLPKYTGRGYRIERHYPVNDPEPREEPVEDDDPEPHGRPEECPECGSEVVYEARYGDDFGEGAAWLCTSCRWGQWLTA